MDKNNFQDFITTYLDGDLSDSEKLEFERILESQPECNSQFNGIKNLIINFNSIPKEETSPEFISNLNRRIASLSDSQESREFNSTESSSLINRIKEVFFQPNFAPIMGVSLSLAFFITISFYLINNESNIADGGAEIDQLNDGNINQEEYWSDIDSIKFDEYEGDIQQTNGENK